MKSIFPRARVRFPGIAMVLASWFAATPVPVRALDETVLFDEGRLAVTIPDGWKELPRNRGETLAGFESSDSTTSIFFREFRAPGSAGMRDILDATVANFEAQFRFTEDGVVKDGQVKGKDGKSWVAVFTTFEAEGREKKQIFAWKFYLLLFDLGDRLVMTQATTTLPVRQSREREIMETLRSIVAKE